MSAPHEVKKRSWGKTRPKEGITVVDRDKIEGTLQILAEEAKRAPKVDGDLQNVGFDPELMNNEDLISALKRIKVPIPVYADGRASRERLLYLYKTNVLPRPQRNRWRGRKRQQRKESGISQQESVREESVMEVDKEDNDWSSGTKKRKLSDSDKMEGISPCKKILVDTSQACLMAAVVTPPPVSSQRDNRMVGLKRPAISTITSGTSAISISPDKLKPHPTHDVITTAAKSCRGSEDVTTAAKKPKVCREKITWP